MRKHPILVAGAALALALALMWALTPPKVRAQISNVVANTLTGNECWQGTQFSPGGFGAGPGIYICSFLTSNSVGTTATSQTTGAIAATLTAGQDYIFTAALTGGITVTAPPSPVPNGYAMEFINGTTSAFTQNITLAGNGSQTVVAGTCTTLGADGSCEFRYALSTNTWYRFR